MRNCKGGSGGGPVVVVENHKIKRAMDIERERIL